MTDSRNNDSFWSAGPSSKHLLQPRPADWVALAGLPPGTSLEVIDADLSTVSTAADKLIRVNGPKPYGVHVEFQGGPGPDLDRRVLVYNVLSRHRMKMSVWSVVFLLRPEAMSEGIFGLIANSSDPDHELKFKYKVIRVWEIPVGKLLSGGLGTLALAPISAVAESDLPRVIEWMKRRLDSEVTAEEARELWTATRILMGLRYPPDMVGQMLKKNHWMEASTTYWEISKEGFEMGRIIEARSILMRTGLNLLGPPDAAVRARLETTADLQQLEDLVFRLLDRPATTWSDLLS